MTATLRRAMITIVPHRSSWSVEFLAIAATLRAGLGGLALHIDHIGSTAVPGLCAKDVIDLPVAVLELDGGVAEKLRELGFVQHPDIRGDHVPPGYAGPESDWAKLFFVHRTANVASTFTFARSAGRTSASPCSFATTWSLIRRPQRRTVSSSSAWRKSSMARMRTPMSRIPRST